jgi:hypothetical protein
VNDWPVRVITTEQKLDNTWLSPDAPGRKHL